MTDMKLLAEFVEEGLAATGILDDAHEILDSIREYDGVEEMRESVKRYNNAMTFVNETLYFTGTTNELKLITKEDPKDRGLISMIPVHNLVTGTYTYADLDALILSTCEWYDEHNGECQMEVGQNDRLITMTFTHFGSNDSDTSAVIIKDELPDYVDPDDLVAQLVACG